jgi:hypothetical protein
MSDQKEIERAARNLMQMYGDDAARVAEQRAKNTGSDHNPSGNTWRKIAQIIRELQAARGGRV